MEGRDRDLVAAVFYSLSNKSKATSDISTKNRERDTQEVSANSSISEELAADDDSFGALQPPLFVCLQQAFMECLASQFLIGLDIELAIPYQCWGVDAPPIPSPT